jgi:hypothetical protein
LLAFCRARFIVVLPYGYGQEGSLSIHEIRIVDGVPNGLIAGSGTKLALKSLAAPYSALPPLGGSYRSFTQRRVFMTGDELKDMGPRIDWPGGWMRLANTGLTQPNGSIRCGTECSRIVYSVRIVPPQPT